jgi:hypothetical protein
MQEYKLEKFSLLHFLETKESRAGTFLETALTKKVLHNQSPGEVHTRESLLLSYFLHLKIEDI